MSFGDIGGGILGAIGANEQENAEYGRYQDFLGLGNYYRQLLKNTYKPGGAEGYLSGEEVAVPTQLASDAATRSMSARGGAVYGNPAAQAEIQKYVSGNLADRLANYRGQLANFGGQPTIAGQGTINQSNRQLDASKNVWNAYGYLANAANPFSLFDKGGFQFGQSPGALEGGQGYSNLMGGSQATGNALGNQIFASMLNAGMIPL